MKKILLSILLLFMNVMVVQAYTINDLYERLNDLRMAQELYDSLSSKDINEIKNKLKNINTLVDSLYSEINKLDKEIMAYQEEIDKYKEEVNQMMIFYQVLDNPQGYIEYVMDANDYVNLVYRKMAIKQITEYYDNKIEVINNNIKEIQEKREDLSRQIENVNKEREKYKRLELVLKGSNSETGSFTTTIQDDIYSIMEEINLYKSKGCKDSDNLSFCLNTYNDSDLVYPLVRGCVSKNYDANNHKGIDLACNSEGKNVYASGSGVVSRIVNRASCGGNIVFIYHNVRGREYTTIYAHLLEIKVLPGQVVNKDTVIGTVGGESTAVKNGGYDRCTTGAHLHYAVGYGYHAYDYEIYLFEPRYLNDYPDILKGYFDR